MSNFFPKKIVCMTEESVEFFYAIGRSDLIAGVSNFAVRPLGVKKHHPVISAFTHANIKKILELKPDLVVGFSDIQKDIAKELIGAGVNVFISNQRSITEIFQYLSTLGHMVGEGEKTNKLLSQMQSKIDQARSVASTLSFRPRVYIEEWDEPRICGIRWFSELVELCGGIDIFKERSEIGSLASERFITDEEVVEQRPDIIFACWCGKPVDIQSIKSRVGYSEIEAVVHGRVYELAPEIFLQPGIAPFVDGIDQLLGHFLALQHS